MQTSMRGRPRPVTATVTKPRWMQVPDPDAMARIRRRSLESNGSTESLTSLLDHESYTASLSDEDMDKDVSCDVEKVTDTEDNRRDKTRIITKEHSSKNNQKGRETSPYKRTVSTNNLSAWEKWVIHKEKEERQKRHQEKEKKKEEHFLKEKEQQEKVIKLQKAEIVRKSWTEKKDKEEHLAKKMEKAKITEAQQQKEQIEEELKQKAVEKFSLWKELKTKEEKQKKHHIKEESKKIEEHEVKRKERAEECFQRWLKQAKHRPKSAPNSFGIISGKVIGYHDRSAYPQPSFVNPVPWQPIAAPSSSNKPEKTKTKNKPYNWNPNKYL